MDAKELKKYIIENKLIIDVLEKLGCHSFVNYSKELRCALPGDNDNSKVSVFDDLSVRVFTKGETIYGSIYDLIMFINKSSFVEALKTCNLVLGLKYSTINKEKSIDHLEFFKKIKKKKNNSELETYEISLLDRYSDIPHIDLIRKDGIMQDIIDKYHIKFDDKSNRIVFPHFIHNDKSKIVGLVGRTVNPAYESLKIPKYFPVDGYKYEKSKNLYGLSHNLENIKKDGLVIVFESEKSVLKSDMFKMPYGVSVGSHDISEFQKKLLISLNVEIVIAFDKDVEKSHVERLVRDMSRFRKVSFIEDKWKLLKEKDCCVDRGYKRFHYLIRHRHYL
ncbi:hypothetical protein P4571_08515 [Niallia alba]|uniref:hypothetical protein n=1 Tax=Niallia alba TaxID=2729105 RepID=UPI002E21D54C|nr:hypothetical protein [Niallia alba]